MGQRLLVHCGLGRVLGHSDDAQSPRECEACKTYDGGKEDITKSQSQMSATFCKG